MLYNRAAYTLYIKAYIKYKNKTSNAFLPLLAAWRSGPTGRIGERIWGERQHTQLIFKPVSIRVRVLKKHTKSLALQTDMNESRIISLVDTSSACNG